MDDNEWETISRTTTATSQSSDEDDIVLVPQQPSSLFPPNNHEGLPLTPPQPSSSSRVSDESEVPYEHGSDGGVKGRLEVLRSEVLRIAYGIRNRVGVWSIATMVVVVAVVAAGRRWQRWRRGVQKESRDRMTLLIHQKDEKIKQLLIQIDQLNELLSARRRVPVQRIVVDRPFINKQRMSWKPT